MAGFGPWLIPDGLLRVNHQATLARGVRLSLAEAGQVLSWRRLWVSWAQTLSKRPDLSRVLTIIVFAASLVGSLPMGHQYRGTLDRASAGGGCEQCAWRW